MKNKLKNLFNKIANMLFPENLKCIFCGDDIPDFDSKPFCDKCEKSLPINNGKKCKICDLEISGESEVCDFCKTNHKFFDKTFAPFKYEGDVQKAVIKFKGENAKYLAKPMASLIVKYLGDEMNNIDFVVPVPSSEKSMKRRGYNQCNLLAKEIEKLSGKEVRYDLLVKDKETAEQKNLPFAERKTNIESAFKLLTHKRTKGKNILLIDDVMTTGATANACARLLKPHCNKVYVAVFARNTISPTKK